VEEKSAVAVNTSCTIVTPTKVEDLHAGINVGDECIVFSLRRFGIFVPICVFFLIAFPDPGLTRGKGRREGQLSSDVVVVVSCDY
jgi:hypothetical protein